jgi:hypothetical protein
MFFSNRELDALPVLKVFLKDLTHLHTILFRLLRMSIQLISNISK